MYRRLQSIPGFAQALEASRSPDDQATPENRTMGQSDDDPFWDDDTPVRYDQPTAGAAPDSAGPSTPTRHRGGAVAVASQSPGFISQDVPQAVVRRTNVKTSDQAVGAARTPQYPSKARRPPI